MRALFKLRLCFVLFSFFEDIDADGTPNLGEDWHVGSGLLVALPRSLCPLTAKELQAQSPSSTLRSSVELSLPPAVVFPWQLQEKPIGGPKNTVNVLCHHH